MVVYLLTLCLYLFFPPQPDDAGHQVRWCNKYSVILSAYLCDSDTGLNQNSLCLQSHHAKWWNSTSASAKGEYSMDSGRKATISTWKSTQQTRVLGNESLLNVADISCRTWVCLWGSCWSVQPKARTSSEESMAGEDDRTRKPSSLYAPTPLIRTSSGTHVRPKPHPRSSRHSGWLLHFASMSLNRAIYIISSNKSKLFYFLKKA